MAVKFSSQVLVSRADRFSSVGALVSGADRFSSVGALVSGAGDRFSSVGVMVSSAGDRPSCTPGRQQKALRSAWRFLKFTRG